MPLLSPQPARWGKSIIPFPLLVYKKIFQRTLDLCGTICYANYGDTKGGEAVSPKMGRPTLDPKKHETRIRMSDEDVRLLEICCQKTGMSKADVIRKGIREVYEKVK